VKQVLIVDDSETVRREIATALKNAGFGTVEAGDGEAGLARVREQRFSLIILDVNMPRMNGLEFLERFNARGFDVPVVMLTTEGEPELIQRAKSLGAKGWLIKPFKPEFLAATAKKWAPLAT
jgi:two-component system chemotaxis response regulator CheY